MALILLHFSLGILVLCWFILIRMHKINSFGIWGLTVLIGFCISVLVFLASAAYLFILSLFILLRLI